MRLALFSKIKLAYKQHRLCAFHVQRYTPELGAFLQKMQSWGLLSHFEIRGVRVDGNLTFKEKKYVKCVIYLKYFNQRPAVNFWTFGIFSQKSHIYKVTHLHRLAWYQPGILYILSTKQGLMTAAECLKQRCGGTLFLAIRGG